jgi:hypothetical protein
MAADEDESPEQLSPREKARLRARERKRTTRMVVDSAGLKRNALALAHRRAGHAPTPPESDPAA